jgi:Stress responsive A/B Barrel Domain
MFRHVILMRFAPGTTDEPRRAVLDGLRALPAQIPEIRDYQVGADLGLRDGSYDIGLVALFDDEQGWRTYLDHPAHVAVVTELIAPHVQDRASVQFEV